MRVIVHRNRFQNVGARIKPASYFLFAINAASSGVCMLSLSILQVPFSKISWAKCFVAVIAALVKPDP